MYESPVNVCSLERNKSISSFSSASGERCPSLRGHNPRNFCAWVQRVVPMQINIFLWQIPLITSRRGRQVQCRRQALSQVQCRWQALACVRLQVQAQVNVMCWCKRCITLSPPPFFLQSNRSHPSHLALNPQEIIFGKTTNLLALVGIELSPFGGGGGISSLSSKSCSSKRKLWVG